MALRPHRTGSAATGRLRRMNEGQTGIYPFTGECNIAVPSNPIEDLTVCDVHTAVPTYPYEEPKVSDEQALDCRKEGQNGTYPNSGESNAAVLFEDLTVCDEHAAVPTHPYADLKVCDEQALDSMKEGQTCNYPISGESIAAVTSYPFEDLMVCDEQATDSLKEGKIGIYFITGESIADVPPYPNVDLKVCDERALDCMKEGQADLYPITIAAATYPHEDLKVCDDQALDRMKEELTGIYPSTGESIAAIPFYPSAETLRKKRLEAVEQECEYW